MEDNTTVTTDCSAMGPSLQLISVPDDFVVDLSPRKVGTDSAPILASGENASITSHTMSTVSFQGDIHQQAVYEIYRPQKPVAMAPLRWNVKKVGKAYEEQIEDAQKKADIVVAELEEQHRMEEKKAKTKFRKHLTEAKKEHPLEGRLRLLVESEANLRRVGRIEQAEAIARRIPPLEKKFYEAKIGGFLSEERSKLKALKGKQRVELARARLHAEQEQAELLRLKDLAIKAQIRSNPRSFQDPWSLHYAASQGEMDRLELLLHRYQSKSEGDQLVVRMLMDRRDRDTGKTALHFAARAAKMEAVDLLLSVGVDVNSRDPEGLTPLHLAAGWGSKQVCERLLSFGADKAMRDHSGRTAQDLAEANQKHDTVHFLQRWLQVGLTKAEQEALSQVDDLTPLELRAKQGGDSALYLQLRSLSMKEATLGRHHVSLAATLSRLSHMLRERGDTDHALRCMQRLLEVTEAHHGDLSLEVGAVLNDLGVLCYSIGRFHEAEACLTRAVNAAFVHEHMTSATTEELRDMTSSMTSQVHEMTSLLPLKAAAAPVRNLALVYFRTGQLELAEPLLARHLALEEEIHRSERIGDVVTESAALIPSLEVLAFTHLAAGAVARSLALYQRALGIARDNHGTVSEQAARQLEHMAMVHFVDANFTQAERVFREAHDILLTCLGDQFHPKLLRICRNMAAAQCKRGPGKF